jgi:hypothetical protein
VHDHIRPRPWGAHAHVEAQLALPDLATYPIGTPIPVQLRVTSRTKPLRASEHPAPRPSDEKPLFPAPPVDPAQLELQVDRAVWIKAKSFRDRFQRTAEEGLGGFGAPAGSQACEAVRVEVQEPVWIPEGADEKSGEGKGVWSRTVVFESAFVLSCPPTLETPILTCNVSPWRATCRETN